MKQDLNKRIDETLACLDGLHRAEANPFLMAKIRNRLHEVDQPSFLPKQFGWKLAMVMMVFVVLNTVTAGYLMKDKKENSGASAVATEYSISLPEAY